MREIELLAPAKNVEIGIAAINAGADAVYIGANKFGARKAAANSVEDISKLIKYAHQYRAKVFVALNTILYNNELKDAVQLVHQLWNAGADAMIIQDMGLLEADLPPIPLHASTQANNRTIEKVRFLEDCGFTRVVLARELNLKQIAEIRQQTSLELEFFIHGALCVSYSGNCYMSLAMGTRSGNRGECAQPCRLKYAFTDSQGTRLLPDAHHLSLKDLNHSSDLLSLADAGISSLKIEGRLKDEAYVINTVTHYRREIDQWLEGSKSYKAASSGKASSNLVADPQRSFNRGFSSYFLHNRTDEIYASDSPKAIGQPVGVVTLSGKGFMVIAEKPDVVPGDGLCYFSPSKELMGCNVNKINGARIELNNPVVVPPGTLIYRNFDKAFEDKISSVKFSRKLDLSVECHCNADCLIITATDEDNIAASLQVDNTFEEAKNAEKALESLRTQLSKTGDTIWQVTEVKISGQNVPFVPVSQLNELRRKLLIILLEKREAAFQPESVVRDKTKKVVFPTSEAQYSENISNDFAKLFYEKSGAQVRELAPELTGNYTNKALMTTKLCMKYKAGFCPVHLQNKQKLNEPLYLLANDKKFRLEFDCKKCEMLIFLEK